MISSICGTISNSSDGHIEMKVMDDMVTLKFVNCNLNTSFIKINHFVSLCIKSYKKEIPEYWKNAMASSVMKMVSEAYKKGGSELLNVNIVAHIHRDDEIINYNVTLPNSEYSNIQYYRI